LEWSAQNVQALFYNIFTLLGEKKLDKIITPDVWKDGSRNPPPGKDAGKKLNTNKLLEKKKFRYKSLLHVKYNKNSFDPYGSKCKLCKCNVPEKQIYCHSCSYSKGKSNFL
jgi:hypothetical protein